jgi:hypothetical protein
MARRSLCVLALFACAPAAVAQSISLKIECADLKLERAVGVPDGPAREYGFSGSCALYHVTALGGQGKKPYHTFPVKAEGAWDAKTNRFRETITILGQFDYLGKPVSGSVTSVFACSYDPVTSPTACNGTSHANATPLEAFSEPYESHKPILAQRATMAQAVAIAVPPRQAMAPAAKAVKEAMQPPRQSVAPAAQAVKDAMQVQTAGTAAANDSCTGIGEIALEAGARVVLDSGRILAADDAEGELRWAILGANGEPMRRFPAESRAYRFPAGEIAVDWGGGVFRAGRERRARLKLPSGQ